MAAVSRRRRSGSPAFNGILPPSGGGLAVEVVPDGEADATVAVDEHEQRHEEVGKCEPGDVGLDAPALGEGGHALVGVGAVEDEELRHAQQPRHEPRDADHHVRPARGPRAVRQRVANGLFESKVFSLFMLKI